MRIKEVPRVGRRAGKLLYSNRPTPDANDDASRNPSWQQAIDKAIRAYDPATLLPLVYAAEAALFIRSQDLSDRPDTIEEREAIRAAIDDLLEIKIHRLKWPDFRCPRLSIVK